ncbi:MAG: diguanylate cyclase [Piscinibacter sp.]|nr:diguanylate cyclase [Piscinibacter sp.]
MTDPLPSATDSPASGSLALLASLGQPEGALLGALLEALDRLELPLAIKDLATGQYRHANARMVALLGVPADQVMGSTDAQWLEASQWPALRTAEQAAAAMPHGAVSEHRLDIGGQRREFSVARVPLASAGGAPRLLCCLWTELTEARAREARLQQALGQIEQQQQAAETLRRESYDQALRDSVTGLYQPAHFGDQLRREVDLSSREHREFSLVSIAIDPPGDEVRSLGAPAATRILEALGRLLRGNTRAMDASCRLDDSHFAVLLSGVGLATAHSRMEGLRRQCATQIVVLEGRNLGFTVSMGVASFPHTAHTQEALVQAAETALAEARKRGGNHVTLASIRFEN